MFILLPCSMVWQETAESREMAEDFLYAVATHGLSKEQAADYMGITPAQLSAQLANRAHLSLWRMSGLPLAVQSTFYARRIKRSGGMVVEDPQMRDLVGGLASLLELVQVLPSVVTKLATPTETTRHQEKRSA